MRRHQTIRGSDPFRVAKANKDSYSAARQGAISCPRRVQRSIRSSFDEKEERCECEREDIFRFLLCLQKCSPDSAPPSPEFPRRPSLTSAALPTKLPSFPPFPSPPPSSLSLSLLLSLCHCQLKRRTNCIAVAFFSSFNVTHLPWLNALALVFPLSLSRGSSSSSKISLVHYTTTMNPLPSPYIRIRPSSRRFLSARKLIIILTRTGWKMRRDDGDRWR